MEPEELKQIEELIKKHKPQNDGFGCLAVSLFLLFILGFFKGCGY